MDTQHTHLKVPLSFDQFIDLVRQLSPKEKQELGNVLWKEFKEDEIDIPEEHKKIVRQRLKRMDECPESSLTWDDIEDKIRL